MELKQVHASVVVSGLPAGDEEEQGRRPAAASMGRGVSGSAPVLRRGQLQPLPHPTSPIVDAAIQSNKP